MINEFVCVCVCVWVRDRDRDLSPLPHMYNGQVDAVLGTDWRNGGEPGTREDDWTTDGDPHWPGKVYLYDFTSWFRELYTTGVKKTK